MKRQSVRKAHSLWIVVALLWLVLILILASQSYKQQTIVPYLSNIITPKQLSESLPDVTIRYGSKVIRAKLAAVLLYRVSLSQVGACFRLYDDGLVMC